MARLSKPLCYPCKIRGKYSKRNIALKCKKIKISVVALKRGFLEYLAVKNGKFRLKNGCRQTNFGF